MYVSLILKGINLNPDDVSQILEHPPSKAFKKGDKFGRVEERCRDFGGWFFYSSDAVDSNNIEEHVAMVVQLINGATSKISDVDGVEETVVDIFLSIGTKQNKSNMGEINFQNDQLMVLIENGVNLKVSYDAFVEGD